MSFKILGTGSALPAAIVTNDDLAQIVDTSDEWIRSRTGIRERRIIRGETLTELTAAAAKQALGDANIEPDELDLILCATLEGDYIVPSLACTVQTAIGAHCPAMDIGAACTGFLYGLDVAAAYFAAGKAHHILLIGAEYLSRFIDFTDRGTCVLFGDGAGAVVLERGEGLRYLRVWAQGRAEPLNIPASHQRPYISMNGQEIFRFAVTTVLSNIKLALKETKLQPQNIDCFLLHQANGRIIEEVQNRLNIPEDKLPQNLERCGNTSAACIPLLLDELNRKNRFKIGDTLLLAAFGGGLTSGVCILDWGK